MEWWENEADILAVARTLSALVSNTNKRGPFSPGRPGKMWEVRMAIRSAIRFHFFSLSLINGGGEFVSGAAETKRNEQKKRSKATKINLVRCPESIVTVA